MRYQDSKLMQHGPAVIELYELCDPHGDQVATANPASSFFPHPPRLGLETAWNLKAYSRHAQTASPAGSRSTLTGHGREDAPLKGPRDYGFAGTDLRRRSWGTCNGATGFDDHGLGNL